MREAIGGTWLFNLVIFFVLLFAGYMCLSINYSKAFGVKDKIINELERNGGVKVFTNSKYTDVALTNISNYMKKVGYRTKGSCKGYSYGCTLDGKCTSVNSSNTTKYAFCLSEVKANDAYSYAINGTPGEFIYVSYYKVKVFYQLDLPIIRTAFDFNIKGDTKILYKTANKH